MPIIQGTLIKITGFLQLIINIDENTYETLQPLNVKAWTHEGKFYTQLSLNKYDKQVIKHKFEPLLKSEVNIKAVVQSFTPENQEPKIYMLLQTIYKCKINAMEKTVTEIAESNFKANDGSAPLTAVEKMISELAEVSL